MGRNVDSIISWGITGHLQNKSKVRQIYIKKQGHYTIFNRSEQAGMKKYIFCHKHCGAAWIGSPP